MNPYAVNQSTVRKQLLNIHVLSAEVGVILKYGIRSVEDAKDTYWKLILENRKSGKQGLGRKELEANQKYQALRKEAEKVRTNDQKMDILLNQMEELERQYPAGLLMISQRDQNQNPDIKILRRLIREEHREKEATVTVSKKGELWQKKNQNQGKKR